MKRLRWEVVPSSGGKWFAPIGLPRGVLGHVHPEKHDSERFIWVFFIGAAKVQSRKDFKTPAQAQRSCARFIRRIGVL